MRGSLSPEESKIPATYEGKAENVAADLFCDSNVDAARDGKGSKITCVKQEVAGSDHCRWHQGRRSREWRDLFFSNF